MKVLSNNELIVAYTLICCVLAVNAYLYLTLPDAKVCTLTDKFSNLTLEGNCSYLKKVRDTIISEDMIKSLEEYNMYPPTTHQNIKTVVVNNTVYVNVSKSCPVCTIPDCICECPICSKCPSCDFEFTEEQNSWWLNDCKIKEGSPGYQAGSADTCFKGMDYFKVEGRPKFKTRSSNFYRPTQAEEDCLISFLDPECDGAFYINNTIWQISGKGVMKWVHKK